MTKGDWRYLVVGVVIPAIGWVGTRTEGQTTGHGVPLLLVSGSSALSSESL